MTQLIALASFQNIKGAGHGRFEFSPSSGYWLTTDITDTPIAVAPVPVVGQIRGFGVQIMGRNDPVGRPTMSLVALDAAGQRFVIGAVQDNVTYTVYQTWHTLADVFAAPYMMTTNLDYWVEIHGEFGTGALVGQKFRNAFLAI